MTPEKWTKSIDESTKAFLDAFSGLTAEQLNWKPDPNTWSIGQNIHHLIVINSTYYPTFEALKSGQHKTPFLGKIGFITNFFGNFILKSIQPEYERKTRTLPIW